MKKFINGKIYIEGDQFAEAMAVEDGRIAAVGSVDAIENLQGDTVDLEGRTVLPGFIESHLHLTKLGEQLMRLNLVGATSKAEVVERGKQYIKEHPDMDMILGSGWNQDYYTDDNGLLNRHDLDKISTEVPIIAQRTCVHITSCNTKALEMLNLPEDIEVEGGDVYRDEEGNFTGVFAENAQQLIQSLIKKDGKEDIQQKFRLGAELALKRGLTTVHSCDILMADEWEPMHSAIREIYKNHEVPIRYYSQFNFNEVDTLKKYLEEVYSKESYDDWYQRGAIKLFKDGVLGARTALLSGKYFDDPDAVGIETISDEDTNRVMQLAEEFNARVVTHVIGDLAVKKVLDSYETVMDRENSLRHGLIHVQITEMADLERIARDNVNVSFQPIFLEYDITMVEDRVGKEMVSTSYAHNTLYNKLGAHTAYGTDCPVEDLNPFPCIYSAVTRQRRNGEPEGGFYPEERVSVTDAIDCYTIEGAYMEGNEDRKGRIKPGYFADFIVLDRDIFTIDPMDIPNIEVEATYVDGDCVYSK